MGMVLRAPCWIASVSTTSNPLLCTWSSSQNMEMFKCQILLTRGQTSFCMHLATSTFLCSCSYATKSSSVQRRVQRRFRGLRQRQWWWHRKQRWSFEGNSRATQWSSGGTVKSYSSLVIQQIAGSTFVCDDLVVGLRVYPFVLGLGFSCHWYDCRAWCVCSVQADHMVVLIGHRRRKTPKRFLFSPLWQRFCGRFYLKCCSSWIGPNLSTFLDGLHQPSSAFISLHPMWPSRDSCHPSRSQVNFRFDDPFLPYVLREVRQLRQPRGWINSKKRGD